MNILIVEDEQNLGNTLSEYLEMKGHNVKWAENCAKAQSYFEVIHWDVLLMDIGLPDGSGLDLARKFRKLKPNVLLLFLSAMNDPETRVEGLEIGADDFITKPFDLRELNLRLSRLLKGKEGLEPLNEEISHGKLKIWFHRYELQDADGQMVSLSQKECAILAFLYKHKSEVISRDDIIDEVWGEDLYPSQRTVDNYIVKLRKWCDTDPRQSLIISSIRGVGYRLEIKDEQ